MSVTGTIADETSRPSGDAPLDLSQSPAWEALGFLLAMGAHRMRVGIERELEPMGLEVRHYGVLATIRHFGPVSQQQLSGSVCIDRSTMVALLDELEGGGLVRRDRDAEDRRVHRIHLTGDGVVAFEEATRRIREVEDQVLGPLARDERAELIRMLQVVADRGGTSGFEHIHIKKRDARANSQASATDPGR